MTCTHRRFEQLDTSDYKIQNTVTTLFRRSRHSIEVGPPRPKAGEGNQYSRLVAISDQLVERCHYDLQSSTSGVSVPSMKTVNPRHSIMFNKDNRGLQPSGHFQTDRRIDDDRSDQPGEVGVLDPNRINVGPRIEDDLLVLRQ